MQQQSENLDIGKRLKCGEVFVRNYGSFTCAVECTLCEDRPSCNLQDFFDHIQVWHQEDWKVSDDDSEKFELEQSSGETYSDCECDVEADISKQSTPNIQPFEEVLIQIDENGENEFDFSDEGDNYSDTDCAEDEKSEQQCIENASAFAWNKDKVDLSIDDLAFKNLNIQCAEVDTTNSAFENDFRLWCRTQHRARKTEWSRSCSEDSGVHKSETSSISTSPPLSTSDESDNFQINETNIEEQIHFAVNEPLPKPKLTTANMEKLIELYQQHPRLWQPSHNEHHNAQSCRQSWQEIRQKWNKICKVNLSENDIRIRLSTLKQRYLKERQRHEMYQEHENFDKIKNKIPNRFRYYEKLKFLDEKELAPYTSQGARISWEYAKLIEVYARFPVLWDKNCSMHKNADLRQQAYKTICTALQLNGIHLSAEAVRLRLSTLKKRYRLAKIQHLQCRLKGRTFISDFKHYEKMKFLDKHIAPYVCDACGKIFRLFNEYQSHLNKEKHKKFDSLRIVTAEEKSAMAAEKIEKVPEETDKTFEKSNETSLVESVKEAQEQTTKQICDKSHEIVDQAVSMNPKTLLEEGETAVYEKNKVDKIALEPAQIITYVNEPNAITPLQWTDDDVPIFIMETTLPNEFQENLIPISETNMIQNTNLQQLIVINSEDALLNANHVILVDPKNISIKSVTELVPCDEIKTQSSLLINENNSSEDTNCAVEDTTNKIYMNLINLFNEDLEAFSNNAHQMEIVQNNENDFEALNLLGEPKTMSKNYQNKIVQEDILNAENECSTTTQPDTSGQTQTRHNSSSNNCAVETEISDEYKRGGKANEQLQSCKDHKSMEFPSELTQSITQNVEDEGENRCEVISAFVENKNSLENPIGTRISHFSPSLEANNTIFSRKSKIDLTYSNAEEKPKRKNQFGTFIEVPDSTSHKKGPIEITDVRIIKPVVPINIRTNIKDENVENISMGTMPSEALGANITKDNLKFDIDSNPSTPKGTTTNKRMPYTLTRLTEPQGHKLIELYRLNPQLWDPKHPNFDSRRHKRISWRLLASQFNASFYLNYNWLQVQRKMMDYVKYYRRERKRVKAKPNVPKWPFFEKLQFLDEVNANTTGLQKRMQQRKETLQIIEIYKAHPQLWDTEHGQYTKRNQRQCSIALMCSRLQEVHNITIEPAKLKQCLLELRYNYRTTKLARIEAEKRNEAFDPTSRFEFYDALQFLEPHLPPFNCEKCKIEFKCFSEFSTHCKKEHKKQPRTQCPLLANDIDNTTLDNVCHICGIKFTMRQNLRQHLNRHFCERTLPCSTCDKKFFTKTALEEHQRTHSRIPAVICPECGRTFFNTSKLTQHLKRHRNQRDYPCDQCDKAFYSAFERERHVRRHLNIRDKICPVCGKSFVAGSGYYTHIKLHSKTKQYSCTACKMEFSQYSGLYKHRKKYHP